MLVMVADTARLIAAPLPGLAIRPMSVLAGSDQNLAQ
jgi:hypothetical protein